MTEAQPLTAQAQGTQPGARFSNQANPKGKGSPIKTPNGARLKPAPNNRNGAGHPRPADANLDVIQGVNRAMSTSAKKAARRGSRAERASALPRLEQNNRTKTTTVKAYVGCPTRRIQRWMRGISTKRKPSPNAVK